jgi:hypothetical protein
MSTGQKVTAWVEKLGRWQKLAVQTAGLIVMLGGLWTWGTVAYRAIEGFGPLESQFRGHVREYVEHAEESGEAHKVLDADLHTIMEQGRVLQEQQSVILERLDTLSTEQRWEACMRARERELEAGDVPRDCRPFGGGP